MTQEIPRVLFTTADARKLIKRFVTIYGNARVETKEQQDMLLREYVEMFAAYRPGQVDAAASALIRTSKFWPSPAEIAHTISAQIQTAHTHRNWCAEESKLCDKAYRDCCGALPTPEEAAKRREFLARMRKTYPSVFARDGGPCKELREPEVYDVRQSDITPEMKALIAKRRSAA